MKEHDNILRKQKYFEKLLSSEGQWSVLDRHLDQYALFARQVWMDIPLYDLTELGIGLMYLLSPIELEPFNVFYVIELPSLDELDLGIYIKFEPFDFSIEFPDLADLWNFLYFNFNLDDIYDLLPSLHWKALWGIGTYDFSLYDPSPFRDYLRSSMYKLMQARTADVSFIALATVLQDATGVPQLQDDVLGSRLSLMRQAQTEAFVLGLSPLGSGKLSRGDGVRATIPAYDAEDNIVEVKFKRLEELQFGLYLGIIPLGFGCLMPDETIYNLMDPKRMPSIFRYINLKARTIIQQFALTPLAWFNYVSWREMMDYHACERVTQYDSLQAIRQVVESIVESKLPEGEKNPVKVRQYQNALLHYISCKAKRHEWGFHVYVSLPEEDYDSVWLAMWERQGLNRDVLAYLLEALKPCLSNLREQKYELGQRVRRLRERLSKMLM